MLSINEAGVASRFLHFRNRMQRQSGLAASFWPKDLHDTTLGVAAAQGFVQGKAARGKALTAMGKR
jgi:hypothetical protein